MPISFIGTEKNIQKIQILRFNFLSLFFVINVVYFTLYMQYIYIYTPLECCMSYTSFHIALNFKGNKKTIFIKMTI
jgi:hypothetical protein